MNSSITEVLDGAHRLVRAIDTELSQARIYGGESFDFDYIQELSDRLEKALSNHARDEIMAATR